MYGILEDNGVMEKQKSLFGEFIGIIFAALMLLLIVNTFLCQVFWIPTGSMESTLLVGDRLIVTKYDYWNQNPQRGDIIVFKLPRDSKRHLIKRVIGLPGEEIKIENNKLYIDGEILQEKYINNSIHVPNIGPVIIPANHYYMMGDNRNNSRDSRDWGALSKNMIVGKAKYRYWPLNRIGRIDDGL